ncbi:peptide chain release factor N(5)-glutamine methyltransferase [Candidatus Saccharibacteria bacterium]|nr:peptide chain release factor N(5)-glutamine methyltransferase [Candidatus Saccharibacteria bacterium]
MNANSLPPVLVINSWLQSASSQLKAANIASAHLDAELILAHTLRKNRTYLHAHSDDILEPRVQEIADARLALRLDHVPIAYIVGYKEFYGRRFSVTTDTLIPRPESESIIDSLKELVPDNLLPFNGTRLRLVDVGTGSGCLGITAKLELPELEVTLMDISLPALTVATTNAKRLHANVTIRKSDLLQNYPLPADVIVANLPYVDPLWERSPDTNHEPTLALFADDGGKALINKLIDQSVAILNPQGLLLLEADPQQHAPIIAFAGQKGFQLVRKQEYCIALKLS